MACGGCEHSMTTVLRDYLGMDNLERLQDLLVHHGIINEVYLCDICENVVPVMWIKGRQMYFVCEEGHPKRRVNAKTGSFLDDTHLSPQQVIHFCILWCVLDNPRGNTIKCEMNTSWNTVMIWSNYCRDICINWALENRRRIGGIGTVVEIAESKFGREKYHRGHHMGQWVFGGVQRDVKTNFFLVPVENRNKEALLAIIQEWILPGTTIISDCWKSYDTLQDEGFQQLRVNQSVKFVNSCGEVNEVNTQRLAGQTLSIHTNTIKGMWKDCKYSIPTFGRKKEHFAGYLAEYLFKRTFSRESRLHKLLLEAGKNFPPEV